FGMLVGLALEVLALRNVCDHAKQAHGVALQLGFKSPVNFDPPLRAALLLNAASELEVSARLQGFLKGGLESMDVVGVQVVLDEPLPGHGPVITRMTEDFVHTVILPDRTIGRHIPLEDTEGGGAHGEPKTGLAFTQSNFRALALGNVACNAEQAIRFDRGMRTQPTVRPIGHADAELMMVEFIVLDEPS